MGPHVDALAFDNELLPEFDCDPLYSSSIASVSEHANGATITSVPLALILARRALCISGFASTATTRPLGPTMPLAFSAQNPICAPISTNIAPGRRCSRIAAHVSGSQSP